MSRFMQNIPNNPNSEKPLRNTVYLVELLRLSKVSLQVWNSVRFVMCFGGAEGPGGDATRCRFLEFTLHRVALVAVDCG